MTDKFGPRFFTGDDQVRRIGEQLLARTLPRADWTHEAHLAACLWLLRDHADLAPVVEQRLPGIIRAYNASVSGTNDDTQGYHDTLTQLYIGGVRAHIAATPDQGLAMTVNALISAPRGHRNWPFTFYSRDRLFSVAARRSFIAPDMCGFDEAAMELRPALRVPAHPVKENDDGFA